MLLAIDIGNTNIVLGGWDGEEWISQWRLRTVHDRTSDELGIYLRGLLRDMQIKNESLISRIVLCSVVPRLTPVFQDACTRYLGHTPMILDTLLNLGIKNMTDFPAQVGTDRLANAVAAHHLTPAGTASIVIDMGTATKLDIVTCKGEFLGGVIAPGLGITSDALFSRAAKLSQVDLVAPPHVIGRNTIHAIQSGLVYGYVSMIEGLIPKLKAELKSIDTECHSIDTIGTGGLIGIVEQYTDMLTAIDPWLTLRGLQIIADRNA